MTTDDAKRYGIEEEKRRSFIVVSDDKHNRAPAENGTWFELKSVDLGNGSFEHLGDNVVALQSWTPPTAHMPQLTPLDIFEIQRAVDGKTYRESDQAADWVGHAIAGALQLDLGNPSDKQRVKTVQKDLKTSKHLKTEHRKDRSAHSRPYVVTGTRIILDYDSIADLI